MIGELVRPAGADQRHDVVALRQHPGNRDLGHAHAARSGHSPERFHKGEFFKNPSRNRSRRRRCTLRLLLFSIMASG